MQIRGTVDDAAAATAAKKSRTLRQLRLLSAPSDNPLPFTFAPEQRAGRTQSTARGRENSLFVFFSSFSQTQVHRVSLEPGSWRCQDSQSWPWCKEKSRGLAAVDRASPLPGPAPLGLPLGRHVALGATAGVVVGSVPLAALLPARLGGALVASLLFPLLLLLLLRQQFGVWRTRR